MKVKNISNKIVHIGTITILPDSEANIPDEVGNSAPVKAIEDIGIIAIVETAPVAAIAEDATEEPVKKTRSKKAKVEEETAE